MKPGEAEQGKLHRRGEVTIAGADHGADAPGPPACRSSGRPWYSPAGARFPEEIVTDYPDDMTGIPDPLDLITIRDPQGTPWLALATPIPCPIPATTTGGSAPADWRARLDFR
jgi:hypothetical protein